MKQCVSVIDSSPSIKSWVCSPWPAADMSCVSHPSVSVVGGAKCVRPSLSHLIVINYSKWSKEWSHVSGSVSVIGSSGKYLPQAQEPSLSPATSHVPASVSCISAASLTASVPRARTTSLHCSCIASVPRVSSARAPCTRAASFG